MSRGLVACAVVALGVAWTLAARAAEPVAPVPVTREALAPGSVVELSKGWRYHAGDDAAWAAPELDDGAWEVLESPRMAAAKRPASGWPGIGWFRLRLAVDPVVAGAPVALALTHNGASEVYLDGRLVHAFGVVSPSRDAEATYDPSYIPVTIVFDRPGEHVLAVRYSCAASADGAATLARVVMRESLAPGFGARLADASATLEYNREVVATTGVSAAFIGVLLAVGLLHLLLFLFYREQRANLFYSLFAFSFALNGSAGLLINVSSLGYEPIALISFLNRFFLAGLFLFFLAFLYTAFSLEPPRYARYIVALWGLALLAGLVLPARWSPSLAIAVAIFASVSESVRIIVRALKRKHQGAWIIGTGVQLLAFALSIQLLAQIFGVQSQAVGVIAVFGFTGLPLCVSVYLARVFAQTTRNLGVKLAEVEELSARTLEQERREAELRLEQEHERARMALLEAEHERKARELEEARELQLSMLPKTLPILPGLEIAAYMKPATEVGGDYYDFHVAADGTLTLAVGDATGHGLKAGTLVTATKGLFNAFAEEPDIPGIFRRSSLALKRLNLKYLYMALTVAKVKGNQIRLSAAGMPPALVYRAATGAVEEVAIKGMPLGGAAVFPYEERELELGPGDVVVFMSDGFPERFNESGEMLDYARARDVLEEVAGEPPLAIIEHFVETGDAWAGGRPQDDDVTFVVMKMAHPS